MTSGIDELFPQLEANRKGGMSHLGPAETVLPPDTSHQQCCKKGVTIAHCRAGVCSTPNSAPFLSVL